jgi:resuscitation-promoting factor RpfB
MHRGVRYGVITALVLGVVGGGAVLTWKALDKTITIQIDQTAPRTVHTMSRDVRGALDDAGYPLSPHDIVTPAATMSVHTGTTITVVRGRMLSLTLDGTLHNVWVAAPTVGDALIALGLDSSAYSSLAPSTPLPLTPTALIVRSPKSITLVRAGQTDAIESTAPTVGALLSEQGIVVGPNDVLSVPPSTRLTDLMTITWRQVRHQTVTEQQPVPFATSWRNTASIPKGTSAITSYGQNGVRTVTFDVLVADGHQVSKTQVASVVSTVPVDRVIAVGTKVAPAAPTTKPATRKPAPAATTPTRAAAPKPVTVRPAPAPVATPAPKPAAKPVTATPAVRKPVAATPPVKPVVPKPVPKPAPKPAPKPVPKPAKPTTVILVTPGSAQAIARSLMPSYGWNTTSQFSCLVQLWNGESGWRWNATNRSSGAYGIPQALPASKMASAGADWRTNPRTQIRWGMGYIHARYATPCSALSAWLARSPHWY